MANPQIELIRELLAASGFDAGTIHERLAALEASSGAIPAPEGVHVETDALGGTPAEWLTPAGTERERVLLYLHGGGYCIGSINTHRNFGGRLALAAELSVAMLDYRLAPEHPFPAAVDDAVEAYAHLLDLGHDPASIAVGGDSAGGGLTVATLLSLRHRGLPLPAAGVCLSPWADLSQTAEAYDRVQDDPMLSRENLDEMALAYAGLVPIDDPLLSPIHGDHSGLPPLLIEAGDAERLVDDAVTLAERAQAAGVSVDLKIWPDMIHVFQVFPEELLPESGQSLARIASFLRAHLG